MGAIVVLAVGSIAQDLVTSVLLPMTAGGFVYIAAADLIPELQHERSLIVSVVQTVLICLGITAMGLVKLLH